MEKILLSVIVCFKEISWPEGVVWDKDMDELAKCQFVLRQLESMTER